MSTKRLLTILIFAASMLASPKVFAQIGEPRHNFAVGFNAGVGMNSVMFTPTIKQNMLITPSFGGTIRYISEKYFAMICGAQLEVNFAQRGWDEKFENDLGKSYRRTLNYVEIPFLAHIAFGKDKGVQFFIHAGPQVAFLLSEKESFSKDFVVDTSVTYQYKKKINNKFDYGITGGLGLEFKSKRAGNFILEGRYYFGLSDIYNNTKKDYFDRSAFSVISVKFTYLFDLIK